MKNNALKSEAAPCRLPRGQPQTRHVITLHFFINKSILI